MSSFFPETSLQLEEESHVYPPRHPTTDYELAILHPAILAFHSQPERSARRLKLWEGREPFQFPAFGFPLPELSTVPGFASQQRVVQDVEPMSQPSP
jgi:hypothetical protein